jgi:hypothetical protein
MMILMLDIQIHLNHKLKERRKKNINILQYVTLLRISLLLFYILIEEKNTLTIFLLLIVIWFTLTYIFVIFFSCSFPSKHLLRQSIKQSVDRRRRKKKKQLCACASAYTCKINNEWEPNKTKKKKKKKKVE